MKFSVPFNGEHEFIDWLLNTKEISDKISQVYFPADPTIIGSGRKPKIQKFLRSQPGRHPVFNQEAYSRYIDSMLDALCTKQIMPVLLLNGNVTEEVRLSRHRIENYIARLYEKGLKGIVVGDERFLELFQFKKRFPKLALLASVYLGIKDVDTAKKCEDMGFDIIKLAPGINRNPALIEKIQKSVGVKLSLLVNEGCMPFCPHRSGHRAGDSVYSLEAAIRDIVYGSNLQSYKHMKCRKLFNRDPFEILRSPWLSPEVLSRYDHIVDYFKLAGRSLPTEHLKISVEAYVRGKYQGDLRKIIGTFTHMDLPIQADRIPNDFFEKVSNNVEPENLVQYYLEVLREIKKDWGDVAGPVFSKHVSDPDKHKVSYSRSKKLYKKAENIIWKGGPEAKQHCRLADYHYPNYISHASGCRIYDIDGNGFVDYMMAWGTVLLGHAYPDVEASVRRQTAKGSLHNLCGEDEVFLAQRLIAHIPGAEMVRFLTTGSEAVTAAARVARAATGREKTIKYGFHGWIDLCQDEYTAGIPGAADPGLFPLRYNNLEHLEKLFVKNRDQIACVIMEPVKAEAPINGFLEGVKDIVHQHGALLIFDEIKTGFRFGLGGAQAYFNVEPDLSLFSKAAANGYPLAVLAGKKDIFQQASQVWVNGTYHGWLPAIAAAHATLDVLENQPVVKHVWQTGEQLMAGFNRELENSGLDARLRGFPPIPKPVYPEHEKQIMGAVFSQMADRGYYLDPRHVWFISFSHDTITVEQTIEQLREILGRVIKK